MSDDARFRRSHHDGRLGGLEPWSRVTIANARSPGTVTLSISRAAYLRFRPAADEKGLSLTELIERALERVLGPRGSAPITSIRRAPDPPPSGSPAAVLGAAIGSWRVARGWSQVALAAALGTSDKLVSCWERGVQRPQRRHLALLCQLGFVPPARPEPSLPVPPAVITERERMGASLHIWRRSTGRSLTSLAAESGISLAVLSRLENGLQGLSEAVRLKLEGLGWERPEAMRRAA